MKKPVYVLGTGLSHNGSAVLLKDGEVLVGIEKERLSRVKHDGGNDALAVNYCLDAAGISIFDLDLAVQCANFEVPDRNNFSGPRPWAEAPEIPLVSISHHQAHAYSAVGTCDFDDCHVLVIDGCGSPHDQCRDLAECNVPPSLMHCEKDSFYHWDGRQLHTLWKDFSEMDNPGAGRLTLPTTRHSIGGFYAAVSNYCFGNMHDAGKLMGLAPYGDKPAFDIPAFAWDGQRLMVKEEWKSLLTAPARNPEDFHDRFGHFADIALWAQRQVETAVMKTLRLRQEAFGVKPLAYTGGVALNAVANGKLLREGLVDRLYLEPAAGDNGLALGCAYYGWLQHLGKSKLRSSDNTCFGRHYSADDVREALAPLVEKEYPAKQYEDLAELVGATAQYLSDGKTVGWFQGGAEFGPRALGHRSILAHPSLDGMRDHINRNIKFREDFRPFAPAVLKEEANKYFINGRDSPYMILVDQAREDWRTRLDNVIHRDGSARTQTVTPEGEPLFHRLLEAFKTLTGTGVLLNTSFNRRGQPIVERPEDAVALFLESALDVLVMGDWLVTKPDA